MAESNGVKIIKDEALEKWGWGLAPIPYKAFELLQRAGYKHALQVQQNRKPRELTPEEKAELSRLKTRRASLQKAINELAIEYGSKLTDNSLTPERASEIIELMTQLQMDLDEVEAKLSVYVGDVFELFVESYIQDGISAISVVDLENRKHVFWDEQFILQSVEDAVRQFWNLDLPRATAIKEAVNRYLLEILGADPSFFRTAFKPVPI